MPITPLSRLDVAVNSAVRQRPNRIDTWLVVLFIALTLTFAFSGAGGVTRVFFLVGAALLGLLFCSRNPPLYMSLVMWLWFLTPLVRRLVNYQSGWVDTDPILAASLLATLACFPKVCRNLLVRRPSGALPFLLALSATTYGFFVGLFFIPIYQLLIQAANWVAPIFFGLFVFFEYRKSDQRPAIRDALGSTFRWGLLLMGSYALIQFTTLPAWDSLWMIKVNNGAFGVAEPFGVRVFSTTSSPASLGMAAVVGLILQMRQRGTLALFATIAGYAALALCLFRSAWGLWVLATALMLFWQRQKLARFMLVTSAAIILITLSTAIDPVQDVLKKRVQTLSDLSKDGSLQDRSSGYQQMAKYVLANPLGSGLGAMDTVLNQKSDLGGRDSGVLDILLSLGWMGGITYFFALALLVCSGLKATTDRAPFEWAAAATSIAMVPGMLLLTITFGFPACVLWGFGAISIASSIPMSELLASA